MKKLFGLLLVIWAFTFYYYLGNDSSIERGPAAITETTEEPSESVAVVDDTVDFVTVRTLSKESEEYFHSNLLNNEVVADAYNYFSDNLVSEDPHIKNLLAMYLAGSAARQEMGEFNKFYVEVMQELMANSAEVLAQLEKNRKLIASEPFFNQSSLNLAAKLELPLEERAGYIGKSLTVPFVITKDGISPESATMTVALILLKQMGTSYEMISSDLEVGKVASSQESTESLKEYEARVKLYFPEYQ